MHNEDALGNAWFVERLTLKANDDAVMQALQGFHPSEEALATLKDLKTSLPTQYTVDSTATISLKSYRPDVLTYESNNPRDGFAVFSEMYYPQGWKASIDGKEMPFYRVDYTLRGMPIPAGKHEIRFAFEPVVVKTGSKWALMGNILLVLWCVGGIFAEVKGKRNTL